jgi:hypothetical protein
MRIISYCAVTIDTWDFRGLADTGILRPSGPAAHVVAALRLVINRQFAFVVIEIAHIDTNRFYSIWTNACNRLALPPKC